MMNVMIMILPKFCRNIEKKQVNWLKGSSKLHKEGDKWSSRVNRSLSGMERKALRNKQTNKNKTRLHKAQRCGTKQWYELWCLVGLDYRKYKIRLKKVGTRLQGDREPYYEAKQFTWAAKSSKCQSGSHMITVLLDGKSEHY